MIVDSVQIREGSTDLLIPCTHSQGGPGTKTGTVFFNRQMAFNRDVSVMLLRACPEVIKVADAMTATGSRAVRIANETTGKEVVANDLDEKSRPYIEENIRLNGLDNCRCSIRNLSCLLAEESFDYVDLDPFGSPVPFLHSAIRGCRRNGILAVTATDTAPLAGAHRAKCERRYQARPLRGPICHESGLRILIGTVAREAAKFDRGIEPILSFYADHYFRCYVRIREGAQAADRTLSNMGFLRYDGLGLGRSFSYASDDRHVHGPLWGGELHDLDILMRMDNEGMAEEKRAGQYLEIWRKELRIPYLYELGELSSRFKVATPRLDILLDALREHGQAEKTHISPTSFRTDLDLNEINRIYIEASGRKSWN